MAVALVLGLAIGIPIAIYKNQKQPRTPNAAIVAATGWVREAYPTRGCKVQFYGEGKHPAAQAWCRLKKRLQAADLRIAPSAGVDCTNEYLNAAENGVNSPFPTDLAKVWCAAFRLQGPGGASHRRRLWVYVLAHGRGWAIAGADLDPTT